MALGHVCSGAEGAWIHLQRDAVQRRLLSDSLHTLVRIHGMSPSRRRVGCENIHRILCSRKNQTI